MRDVVEMVARCFEVQPTPEQIVAKEEPVIEQVFVRDSVPGVMRLGRVLHQDTRLQPGPVLPPDPRQFQFLEIIKAASLREATPESTGAAGPAELRPS